MFGFDPVAEDGAVVGFHGGFQNGDKGLAFALEVFGAFIGDQPAVLHLGRKAACAACEGFDDVLRGLGLSGEGQDDEQCSVNCFQSDHKLSVTPEIAPVKRAE